MNMQMTSRIMSRARVCALPLVAAGCIPFFASAAFWRTSFEGQVTRADGAPVAGARVSIWTVTSPENEVRGIPDHSLTTDAGGRYRGEERKQEGQTSFGPAFVVVVTPPAGSGLGKRRAGVLDRDVTYERRESESGDNVIRRRLDVVLEPATP